MKDGGVSVSFATQELTPEEKLELAKYYNTFGYMLFKDNAFKPEEVPKEDAVFDEDKTPSKRLRAVIYLWWKKLAKSDFDSFYKIKMEEIINSVKKKLD